MPFAVFRRHQRKLLAIFAILAMFGFVLADSLPRLLSGGYVGGNGDPVVVTLYGKSIHASDINAMMVYFVTGVKLVASSPGLSRLVPAISIRMAQIPQLSGWPGQAHGCPARFVLEGVRGIDSTQFQEFANQLDRRKDQRRVAPEYRFS